MQISINGETYTPMIKLCIINTCLEVQLIEVGKCSLPVN